MVQLLTIVNIEDGMPSVEVARKRLLAKIDDARRSRVPIMKVIHGYGSSGVGGSLRAAVRKSLSRRRSEGKIAKIVFGEQWTIFDATANELLRLYPALSRDSDLERYNYGITIVELCLE